MEVSRGWSQSSRAKPAAAITIRYGHRLLAAESAGWPRYLAVTSPSAYRTAAPLLAKPPAAIAHIRSLDFMYLQQIAASLPDDAELVIGLGGGQALDAAKHIAVAKDLPLVQVPTIISTGAIIHGHLARFNGRTIVGSREEWVWADCEAVLVDYDVTLQAPMHLHTAGLGDVLCEVSGMAEWRRMRRSNPAAVPVAPALQTLAGFHAAIVERFPSTLSEQGELTPASIRFIMETLQQRDTHRVRLDSAPNVDHMFLFAMEEINDRSWIHGEIVALGALIISWYCAANPDAFAAALDRCRIRRRPSQLGIDSDALGRGLLHLAQSLAQRPSAAEFNSVMRDSALVHRRFNLLWEYLETA